MWTQLSPPAGFYKKGIGEPLGNLGNSHPYWKNVEYRRKAEEEVATVCSKFREIWWDFIFIHKLIYPLPRKQPPHTLWLYCRHLFVSFYVWTDLFFLLFLYAWIDCRTLSDGVVSVDTQELLRLPSFNNWAWEDWEILLLLQHMCVSATPAWSA